MLKPSLILVRDQMTPQSSSNLEKIDEQNESQLLDDSILPEKDDWVSDQIEHIIETYPEYIKDINTFEFDIFKFTAKVGRSF